MSTLWTPDGERPIPRAAGTDLRPPAAGPAAPAGYSQPDAQPDPGLSPDGPEIDAEDAERLAALQQQLAQTPAEVIVANHAFGLFELAAIHLSLQPPQLDQARVAIDALGALVEGMPGRLGDAEAQLKEALSQLRMAFVQIQSMAAQGQVPTS